MRDGESVRQLFAEAGVPLPSRLAQFLGHDGIAPDTRIIIPPPSTPRRPAHGEPAWIWVPITDLLAKNLVLGVLRSSDVPMTPKKVIDEARRLGASVKNDGSVMNLGKPLFEDGTIARTEDGWVLKKDRRAPLISDGFAWGPLDIFTVQEVAAHRRQLILHILRLSPSGLQQAQLVSNLEACDWRNGVPVGKDLIKLDIDALAKDNRVRRVGATSKWEATPM